MIDLKIIDSVISSIPQHEWLHTTAENCIDISKLTLEEMTSLRRFIALWFFPKKFNLSDAELFYEQFFWFSMFIKKMEQKQNIENDSLRQQRFKLIERAASERADIDWSRVEQIHKEVENLLL